jgi:hypothetical protein
MTQKKSSIDMIGSITVPKSTVVGYLEAKGIDPVATAVQYIEAWKAKVPSGAQMTIAKMKCALADGPCGCPEDAKTYKCKGPAYLPVPIEVLMGVLFPEDGGACVVEGVEALMLPSPEAIVVDGTVHEVEFVGPHSLLAGGPGKVAYLKKL